MPACPLLQVWLSYAKFEATPLAVLAMPVEEDEALDDEARRQQLAGAEEAEGGEAGTGETPYLPACFFVRCLSAPGQCCCWVVGEVAGLGGEGGGEGR